MLKILWRRHRTLVLAVLVLLGFGLWQDTVVMGRIATINRPMSETTFVKEQAAVKPGDDNDYLTDYPSYQAYRKEAMNQFIRVNHGDLTNAVTNREADVLIIAVVFGLLLSAIDNIGHFDNFLASIGKRGRGQRMRLLIGAGIVGVSAFTFAVVPALITQAKFGYEVINLSSAQFFEYGGRITLIAVMAYLLGSLIGMSFSSPVAIGANAILGAFSAAVLTSTAGVVNLALPSWMNLRLWVMIVGAVVMLGLALWAASHLLGPTDDPLMRVPGFRWLWAAFIMLTWLAMGLASFVGDNGEAVIEYHFDPAMILMLVITGGVIFTWFNWPKWHSGKQVDE